MLVWRIAKRRYALDRTGSGGLLEGGRWHRAGQPVVYAGLTAEIAAFEKLVHAGEQLPADLVLIEIRLPEDPSLYERPALAALPRGWDAIPPGEASAEYGCEFLRSRRALGLIVPSAVVPEARNIVINPLHPKFARTTMRAVRKFAFDRRLRPGRA
jgi:RES domain-containing protein